MMEPGVLRGELLDIPHQTIPQLFQRLLREDGQHFTHCPAIISQGLTMTYSDVDILSNSWSACLRTVLRRLQRQHRERKISEDLANASEDHLTRVVVVPNQEFTHKRIGQPVIGIFIPPNANRIVAMMSVFKVGACYVPLDSTLPDQRIADILEETKCQIVLYETEESHSILYKVTRHLDGAELMDVAVLPPAQPQFISSFSSDIFTQPDAGVDPVLCVLYTSGSTGKPKGVPLRTSNVLNRLYWQWRRFPFSKNEVGCHKTSPLFVDSLTEILGCLLKGIPVVIIPKMIVQNPNQLLNALGTHCISRLVLVPTLLRLLVSELSTNRDRKSQIEALQFVVCSGETLPEDLLVEFFDVFPSRVKLLNFYGSTETTGDITCEIYSSKSDIQGKTAGGFVSIGKPVFNNTVHVLDEKLEHVGHGEVGQIFVSGRNVVSDYLTDEHEGSFVVLNSETHKEDRLYKTGDWGLIQNGRLVYQGRQDSQVKIRGFRVNLREIETVVQRIPGVETVVTLVCPTKAGFRPVAFYTSCLSSPVTVKTVNETCRKNLPLYMLPVFIKLTSVPLQRHTGKVDRRELKGIFLESVKRKELPRKDCSQARIILSIVAEQMGLPVSSIDTSCTFQELGGNSISAVNASAVLDAEGFVIPVSEFFSNQPLSDLIRVAELEDNERGCTISYLSSRFKLELLSDAADKETVIPLLASSFTQKNPLEIMSGTTPESFILLMNSIWKEVLTDNLSVCVRDSHTGKIVGAHIAVDLTTEIDPFFIMELVGEINDDVEKPVKEMCTKQGGRWVDSFLVGCDVTLPDSLVLNLLEMMDRELIRLAQDRRYDGIVTVNSHPVTANVAENILGYELKNSLHVRTWKYRGTYPFHMADDSYCLKAYILRLSKS